MAGCLSGTKKKKEVFQQVSGEHVMWYNMWTHEDVIAYIRDKQKSILSQVMLFDNYKLFQGNTVSKFDWDFARVWLSKCQTTRIYGPYHVR